MPGTACSREPAFPRHCTSPHCTAFRRGGSASVGVVDAGGAGRGFTGASGTEAAWGTGGRGGGGCGGAKETGGAGFATAGAVDEEAGQAAGWQWFVQLFCGRARAERPSEADAALMALRLWRALQGGFRTTSG
jgi:hypothetical protein